MTLERLPASGGLRLRAVAVRYAHKRADNGVRGAMEQPTHLNQAGTAENSATAPGKPESQIFPTTWQAVAHLVR